MQIAILSDIHSNSWALSAALQRVEDLNIPRVIFLGDLLTYGPDPIGVLKLCAVAQQKFETTFIIGNHEQAYFELAGLWNKQYTMNLKPWIEESMLWTLNEIKGNEDFFFKLTIWRSDLTLHDVFMSHANPFGDKDWRYLNSKAAKILAIAALKNSGKKVGVFGHNHRLDAVGGLPESNELTLLGHELNRTYTIQDELTLCLNCGSVGQPRSQVKHASFLSIEFETKRAKTYCLHNIDYDRSKYLNRLSEIKNLSEEAKTEIKKYI